MISVTRGGDSIDAFARSCRVQKNDVGTVSFEVLRDTEDALNIGVGQERFELTVTDDLSGSDLVMMVGRTGAWSQVHDDQAEESAQTYSVSLPGALSTLADAIVYPRVETGLFQSKADTRYFNFASPDWDGWLAWPAAVELFEQGNAATSLYSYLNPKDWPDPDAFWIWGTAWSTGPNPAAAVGPCYFRTEFSIADPATLAIYITADDTWKLYIDGETVDEHDVVYDWDKTFRVDKNVNPGTHTIAVYCTNLNVPIYLAGLIVSIFRIFGDGELQELVLHTDSTWSTLAYPATPPGMTPGEIMVILMDEALARGSLTLAGDAWSYDFDGATDSNGDAWAQVVEITMRIGETVLDALRKLAETWVDIRVDMATQTLQMVNKGGFNTNPNVNLLEGVHLFSLSFDGSAPARAVVLTRDADGNYAEIDSQTEGDRVENLLEAASAPSADAAGKIGAGAIIATSPGPTSVRAVVESIDGAVPLKDFNVFDVIKMPDANGTATNTEILAITAADIADGEDGDGYTAYVVEGEQGRLLAGSIYPGSGGEPPTGGSGPGGSDGGGNGGPGGVIDPEAPPTTGPGSNVLFNLEF